VETFEVASMPLEEIFISVVKEGGNALGTGPGKEQAHE